NRATKRPARSRRALVGTTLRDSDWPLGHELARNPRSGHGLWVECSRRRVRPSTLATHPSSIGVFHWHSLRPYGLASWRRWARLPSTAFRTSLTVRGSIGRVFVPLR